MILLFLVLVFSELDSSVLDKDLYEIFELKGKSMNSIDDHTIKKQFHSLSRKYHPDKIGKVGQEKMILINLEFLQ